MIHAAKLIFDILMRTYGQIGCFVLLWASLVATGCRDAGETQSRSPAKLPPPAQVSAQPPVVLTAEARSRVEAFCGDCHAMPRPASSPKDEWLGEIEQGFSLYEHSGRTDLQLPSKESVIAYFDPHAPVEFVIAEMTDALPPSDLPLIRQSVRLPGPRPPGVTNVRWIDLGWGGSPALVYCDIGTGGVNAYWPRRSATQSGEPRKLATLYQPVHCEPCDLNDDGLTDLVVADIGEFDANDSDLGRVVWLRRESATTETYQSVVLLEGLSRVSDVQPGDFNGDGKTDLLVAEFGWRTTGSIRLMLNTGLDEQGEPQFDTHVIDHRNGAIHVPTLDIDGDGDLDFIALISQEHEVVVAFINDGEGSFDREVVWRAPDPAYGSSGIELVDLDGDGDLDVLYTNGDSFDRGYKPYHGIQWLENDGSFPYTHHRLVDMPGVLNAKAADIDGDGDMDIVACSLLAGSIVNEFADAGVTSLMLLTQTEPGNFEPTQLESGLYNHISLVLDDFDEDGRTDMAVGNFFRMGSPETPDLQIWWNGSER